MSLAWRSSGLARFFSSFMTCCPRIIWPSTTQKPCYTTGDLRAFSGRKAAHPIIKRRALINHPDPYRFLLHVTIGWLKLSITKCTLTAYITLGSACLLALPSVNEAICRNYWANSWGPRNCSLSRSLVNDAGVQESNAGSKFANPISYVASTSLIPEWNMCRIKWIN